MIVSTATRLGEQLVIDGLISQEQLDEALNKQESGGGRLGANLVDMGALSSGALVNTLASRLSVRGCVLRHGLIDPKVAKCVLALVIMAGRDNSPFDRGSHEVSLLYKIPNARFNARLYLQYFSGYGDTLIEYNERKSVLRFGVAL